MLGARGVHVALLGLALVHGCGGSNDARDGSSVPPPGTPVPLSALGEAYETLLCRYFIECQGAAYASVEQCKADRDAPGLADIEAGVAEGRIEYDASAVGDCRSAIDANLCSLPYLFTPSLVDVLDDCTVGVGRQGAGEPCRHDIECTEGHFCVLLDSCPGLCQPYSEQGQACSDDGNAKCAPPAVVTLTDIFSLSADEIERLQREIEPTALRCIDGVCRLRSPIGGPCTSDPDCEGGGWCDGEGTCQAPVEEGASCADLAVACAEGLFCDRLAQVSEGVCRPLSAEGGPCTWDPDCDGELRCVQPDPTAFGVCSGFGAAGEPCGTTSDCAEGLGCDGEICADLPGAEEPCFAGGACAPGLTCASDTCARVVGEGDQCNETDAICFARCVGGTCQARIDLGGPCSQDDECTSRACAAGICVDNELCEHRGSG